MTTAPISKRLRGISAAPWLAGVLIFGTGAALAAQDSQAEIVVPSTRADALPPPEEWRCDLIRPDYAEWLSAGNAPQDYRYAGPTYRDVEDGELYNWQDWLEWERTADCATPGTSSFNGRAAVGAAVSGIGTALLVAGSGENAKSPG